MRDIKHDYQPENDKKIKGDPQKTVFVGRLNYATTEETLRRQFGFYGEIWRLRLVRHTETNKSMGYAFIEFKERRGAEAAYDRADGRLIDERHVIVDMEKARRDRNWLPRRLGGGKGGESRRNREDEQFIRDIRRELRQALKEKEDQEAQLKNSHVASDTAKNPETRIEEPPTKRHRTE